MKIGEFEFKIIRELGKGSYGNVFLINKNGKNKALKVIENTGREGIKSLRELDIMGRIIHPYLTNAEMIVSEFSETKNISKIGIVMDVAERDLHIAMYDLKYTLAQRLKSLYQITKGLKFLHDADYLHLDIKPANILLFKNGKTKLTDFGLSLLLAGESKYYPNELVTVNYRSPSILEGKREYTKEDDVWSLGLVFLDVLSNGKSLFAYFKKEDFTPKKILDVFKDKLSPKNINATLNTFLGNLPVSEKNKAISLLKSMLSFDKRASLDEVLSSPLFNSINDKSYGEIKELTFYKPNCDFLCYDGFDILVRLCTRVSITLETFFLAADIYQRSLSFRSSKKDEKNIIYTATLSLYMAIKMVESYFADAEKLSSLAGNLFKGEDIMRGEAILTNNWNGIFYNKNLFTQSTTLRRLEEGFELARNCFIYSSIDLKEWKRLSQEEEKIEGVFNKYIPFVDFLFNTKYYNLIVTDKNDREYIKNLYEKDLESFK